MRRKKPDFQRPVNGDVAIEFGEEGMTSYAGLELLIRNLQRLVRTQGRLTLRPRRNKQIENPFNRIGEASAKAA